jgi:hypothetical protein
MACFKVVPLAAVLLTLVPFTSQSSPSQGLLVDAIEVERPLGPCAVPRLTERIVQSAHVPAGIEYVPEPCRSQRRTADRLSESLPIGMTVQDALDRLVQLDPRYRWMEDDGVIVMRPRNAWNEAGHFLHRTVSSFIVKDEDMTGALNAVQTALGPGRFDAPPQRWHPTPESERRFSVALGGIPGLEALNAVVRAHGSLTWELSYCQPQARYEYGTLWLTTFDGHRESGHAIFLRDEQGKSYDPCRGELSR